MPAASDVRPGKWSNIRILFDNGWYSVIAGDYRDEEDYKASFGERWNGNGANLGFPNQAGHPIWHVIPPFLVVPILHGLHKELELAPYPGSREHFAAISRELDRLERR